MAARAQLLVLLVSVAVVGSTGEDPRCGGILSEEAGRTTDTARTRSDSGRASSAADAQPPEKLYPHKIPCPMATRVIDSPNTRDRGDVVVPLCSGFGSPWNNYVSVSLRAHIAKARGPRSVV